ncbi:MAG TPA: OsmC family protein, partial [Solirubrobacterales bacterium]|nr:OsmC family protein [Solirubrobacterales bacterium]
MSRARTRLAAGGLAQRVELDRGHELSFDEPMAKGGGDAAASPTETLGAALASCIAITVRMYAERKGWDVEGMEVSVDTSFDGPRPTGFEVGLRLPEGLDAEQRSRLGVIATKCPVHRVLSEG